VLMLPDSGQVGAIGDVAHEPPVLDGHVEDQAEHSMDFLHGGGGVVLGEVGDPGLNVAMGDVGELDPVPLRVDVLANDSLIA